jgi:hypothetical protein
MNTGRKETKARIIGTRNKPYSQEYMIMQLRERCSTKKSLLGAYLQKVRWTNIELARCHSAIALCVTISANDSKTIEGIKSGCK